MQHFPPCLLHLPHNIYVLQVFVVVIYESYSLWYRRSTQAFIVLSCLVLLKFNGSNHTENGKKRIKRKRRIKSFLYLALRLFHKGAWSVRRTRQICACGEKIVNTNYCIKDQMNLRKLGSIVSCIRYLFSWCMIVFSFFCLTSCRKASCSDGWHVFCLEGLPF